MKLHNIHAILQLSVWGQFFWLFLFCFDLVSVCLFVKIRHQQLYLIVSGEVSRRKRSKSEDMDSVHSKRRRYVGEEDYEAEFQVKITARRDVDQKLEKVKWKWRMKMAKPYLISLFSLATLPVFSHTLTSNVHTSFLLFFGLKLYIIKITTEVQFTKS